MYLALPGTKYAFSAKPLETPDGINPCENTLLMIKVFGEETSLGKIYLRQRIP